MSTTTQRVCRRCGKTENETAFHGPGLTCNSCLAALPAPLREKLVAGAKIAVPAFDRRKYNAAAQRAKTRLVKAHPQEFERFVQEELIRASR